MSKKECIEIYQRNIRRNGSKELLKWLEGTDFFKAPASTKYHSAHEGGLCEHSLNVYRFFYQEILQRASEFSGLKCLDTDTEEAYNDAMENADYHLKRTSARKEGKDGRMFRIYVVMQPSHTYNTAEFSKLLEGVISEAKEMGLVPEQSK